MLPARMSDIGSNVWGAADSAGQKRPREKSELTDEERRERR